MGSPQAFAIIVNPSAANGRTGREWSRIEPHVRDVVRDCAVLVTEGPGHATQLVRTVLREGYDRIVSVGGDGTHHEVVNGFFDGETPLNPNATLAVIPCGTGSDLARTLNVPREIDAVPLLVGGNVLSADVGRVRCTAADGTEILRHFLNVAHVGMGAAVSRRVNATSKALGGFASYLWGVLATLATYKNSLITLEIDGRDITQKCRDIIIANGRYDGGGMLVAPDARLDSGVFDIYVIGDLGRVDALINLPKLYTGALMTRPDKVQYFRARRITARSDGPVLVSLEGEQCGALPAIIEVIPGALRVVVGSPWRGETSGG